jgi:hypothetical protein
MEQAAQHAATSVTDRLLERGVLGLVCLLLLLAVIYLQRRNEKQEERHALEMKGIRLELTALYDRSLAEARAWADNGQKIAEKQVAALESMVRAKRGG